MRRQHQRQGDVAQLLPRAGAVDPRRLVDVLRQGFEPGEQEQEAERRPVPDVDHDDRERAPGARSPSQSCGCRPTRPSAWLMTPKS